MLIALMNILMNMQEQMDEVRREIKTKKQKEIKR